MNTYWLANHSVYKQALDVIAMPNASCVFVGDEFRDVMHLSPWLVPAEEVLNLPRALLEQGIILESVSSLFEVNQHLNSLLFVMYEGEEMLLRFYDVNVLIPLIDKFDVTELDGFLGNIHRLHTYGNGLKTYTRSRNHEYELYERPWFKLKPAHMEDLYRVSVHLEGIVRRLWRLFPDEMDIDEENIVAVIKDSLTSSFQEKRSPEFAEILVLARLIENSSISLSTLVKTFHLNSEEQHQLKQNISITKLAQGVNE